MTGPLTVVCAWRHTHSSEKHISGPPKSADSLVSHGICEPCQKVELAALTAPDLGEKHQSAWTLLLRTGR